MFFPWYKTCCSPDNNFTATWKERRLNFLKAVRDDLETRLAAINAAIETIERQNSQTNSEDS